MRIQHCVVALFFLVGAAIPAPTSAQPCRILITNDDGIEAPGIEALAKALGTLGEVVVVAPRTDQSGKARSTSILQSGVPSITPLMRDGGVFGYSVDGTPADSVLAAIYWLQSDRKFDIVVSGINYGANPGTHSLYSGTVGATVEAALAGIPAIAFSQDHRRADYTRSALIATRIVEHVLRHGLAPYTSLNVNIPGGELRGVKVAPMGNSYQRVDRFEPLGSANDGSTGLKLKLKRETEVMSETDTAYYLDGYVTITPLQVDWTAHQYIKTLKTWPLELLVPIEEIAIQAASHATGE